VVDGTMGDLKYQYDTIQYFFSRTEKDNNNKRKRKKREEIKKAQLQRAK